MDGGRAGPRRHTALAMHAVMLATQSSRGNVTYVYISIEHFHFSSQTAQELDEQSEQEEKVTASRQQTVFSGAEGKDLWTGWEEGHAPPVCVHQCLSVSRLSTGSDGRPIAQQLPCGTLNHSGLNLNS